MPSINQTNRVLRVYKNNNQTVNNSTVLVDDDDLFIALAAGSKYIIRAFIVADGGTTSDIKFGWKDISPTAGFWTAVSDAVISNTRDMDQTKSESISASAPDNVQLWGFIETNAAGTLHLTWAQNNAVAENTRVMKGSWLEVILVA